MNPRSGQLMITGASGFLGSRIVDLALDAGWKIRTLNRTPRIRDERVEAFVGDLGDLAVLRHACEGTSVVVHAAGLAHVSGPASRDLASFTAVNEVGTSNLVTAALQAGVAHIVLISSVSVYGPHDELVCDESSPCQPQGPYAVSKWKGELRASDRVANSSASLTILRMATIFGEGDRGNVAKLIAALDRGRFLWPGSGKTQKSLIYNDDAARACLGALEPPSRGIDIFNVSARAVTMREIVTAICQALGCRVPRLSIPRPLLNAASTISDMLGDPGGLREHLRKFIRDDVYSGSKFEAAYHFRPAVSLSEGIQREVMFLRSQSPPDCGRPQAAR